MISPPGPVERAGVVLRPVDEGEWLDFLGRADFVCQEQLPAFALARYHGFDVEPVLFEQEGRTIGGSLMLVRKLPLGLVQLAITKWGPLSLGEAEPGHLARYRGMVDALRLGEAAGERRRFDPVLPLSPQGRGRSRFRGGG